MHFFNVDLVEEFLRKDIPRYQKQQFAHVLLNNFYKIQRNAPALEVFFNLQPSTLLKERRRYIQLSVSFVKFLETPLFWKSSYELVLKGEFYEKWRTDIFIIIKRYLEVDSSFKKQTLRGKVDI